MIRERVLTYPDSAVERWAGLWKAWIASGRQDWSAWEEFERVVKGRGIGFPWHKPGGAFAEALTAKHLHEQGYTNWQGRLRCRLFHTPNFADPARAETTEIERLLSKADLPIPRDYEQRLDFYPRDVDLASFHPRKRAWRFTEVKWKKESLRPGQLQSLGLLHKLLKADVEIVRVCPEGSKSPSVKMHETTFTLAKRVD